MCRILLLCVSLATISAWSAGCGYEKEEKDESADSITVGPTNPTVTVGSSLQLTATAIFADGPSVDITSDATWSTTTAGIATVTGGLVTALSAGTVRISATSDLRTGSTLVLVVPTQAAVGFVEVEPNDLFPDEANDIGAEVSFSGSCDDIDLNDIYSAVVSSGNISLSLAWTEGPTFQDLDLFLYDSEGGFLGSDEAVPEAGVPDAPAEVAAVVPTAMTIYIEVVSFATEPVDYVGTVTPP